MKEQQCCESKGGDCCGSTPRSPFVVPFGDILPTAMGETKRVEEWAAKIAGMERDLADWRAVAMLVRLSSDPVHTPAAFMTNQSEGILRLLESLRKAQRERADLSQALTRVLDKFGQPLPPGVVKTPIQRANEALGVEPVCGFCGKGGCDMDSPKHEDRVFMTEDYGRSDRCHVYCLQAHRRKIFFDMDGEVRDVVFSG